MHVVKTSAFDLVRSWENLGEFEKSQRELQACEGVFTAYCGVSCAQRVPGGWDLEMCGAWASVLEGTRTPYSCALT